MLIAVGPLGLAHVEAQAPANSICSTCELWNLSEPSDSGDLPERGVTPTYTACGIEEFPVTPAVERAFDLDQLRALLVGQSAIEVGLDEAGLRLDQAEQPATTIEFSFELGDFSYYEATIESEGCADEIRASADVVARVGTGLLLFEANGFLWKRRNSALASFYASTDLATATGTYQVEVDASKIHAGLIELSMYAAPGNLRGRLQSTVYYFDNEQQLRRRLQGDSGSFADRQPLIELAFPSDRCEDHELPFAPDVGIEQLRGLSADELRERVASRIAEGKLVEAVWRDDAETLAEIELGEPIEGTACLDRGKPFTRMSLNSEWVVRIPISGRLRSSDSRLDVPLAELYVGVDPTTLTGASLHNWVPVASLSEAQTQALGAAVDVLDVWVTYDFKQDPPRLSGLIDLLSEVQPGIYTRMDCVAIPPGGDRDSRDCRYGR